MSRYYMSRMVMEGYGQKPREPHYLVYADSTVGSQDTRAGIRRLVDHNSVFLGVIKPVRRQVNYRGVRRRSVIRSGWGAYPTTQQFTTRKPKGTAETLEKAADLLVDHLSTTKYGRNVLNRAGIEPTKALKKQITVPPGWTDRQKQALRRLLKSSSVALQSFEVLAESENSWEVVLVFDGRREVWSYSHPLYGGQGSTTRLS